MSAKENTTRERLTSFHDLPLFDNDTSSGKEQSNEGTPVIDFVSRTAVEMSARKTHVLNTILDHANTLDW